MISMAAKTIVTFHPDVACDLCGRRLLRGERPDVFLGGGQRRTVCELCAPRANHEGWRREVEEQIAGPRAPQAQRSRSLLGRLRQLREPVRAPNGGASAGGTSAGDSKSARESRGAGAAPPIEWAGIEREWTGTEDDWSERADRRGGTGERAHGVAGAGAPGIASEQTAGDALETAELGYAPRDAPPQPVGRGAAAVEVEVEAGADAEVRRALEIFNGGEAPRRVAGVARSLGPACVRATPVAGGGVAIVVAWELCWYRYAVDLDDDGAAGMRIAAEGMELEELAAEDRVANAAADEHGMLSLLVG
jgi:hypothetical protein